MGWGGRGNVSACHTPSGTRGDARGTGRFHSQRGAGAAETQTQTNVRPDCSYCISTVHRHIED